MAGRAERYGQGGAEVSPARVEQLECRECDVICERVVSPWRCLRARHSCVYAFEEGDTMYFGCLHKVFLPELDIAPFCATSEGSRPRTDPYGPLRACRSPLPQCPQSIERAYSERRSYEDCMNPGFVWKVRVGGLSMYKAPDGGQGGPI